MSHNILIIDNTYVVVEIVFLTNNVYQKTYPFAKKLNRLKFSRLMKGFPLLVPQCAFLFISQAELPSRKRATSKICVVVNKTQLCPSHSFSRTACSLQSTACTDKLTYLLRQTTPPPHPHQQCEQARYKLQ